MAPWEFAHRQPSFAKASEGILRCELACGLPSEAAKQRRMVGLGRLELPTSRLSSARSNQLSYKPDEASSAAHGLVPMRATEKEGKRGRRQGANCSERRCWDCS